MPQHVRGLDSLETPRDQNLEVRLEVHEVRHSIPSVAGEPGIGERPVQGCLLGRMAAANPKDETATPLDREERGAMSGFVPQYLELDFGPAGNPQRWNRRREPEATNGHQPGERVVLGQIGRR